MRLEPAPSLHHIRIHDQSPPPPSQPGANDLTRPGGEDQRESAAQLVKRTYVCDILRVTGNEFEKRVKRLGRVRGVPVSFTPGHGKGSHGRLYFGDRFTTLKDRRKQIGPGLLNAMLDQLGLSKSDIEL